MSAPLLQVDALAFGHRGRPLGEPVSLDVHAGEIVALLGPNGCGKTAFLRTLLGLLPALGGQVRVAGEVCVAPDHPADPAAMAHGVVYVAQAQAGASAHAVLDGVMRARAAHVGPRSTPSTVADRSAALDALERLGIAHLADRSCSEISGGEQQLARIAGALAQQVAVLVMDEPAAGLDCGSQQRVLQEIEALKGRGVAVLMSTCQPAHALRIADRVALLGRSGLQAVGPAREVMTPARMSALYGVPQAPVDRREPPDAGPSPMPHWAEHYRAHMRRNRLLPKPASVWDSRARDYGRKSGQSRYVEDFLARVDLDGARSVLDVGCGPGTLAIPLARRVDEVVALDYSRSMLAQLQEAAAAAGVANIHPLHRAWEDDWSDVPVCDIAIASRSTAVDDLDAAIGKLCRHARLRVYLTYLASGQFIDPGIVAVLRVDVPRAPEPLALLGMLYQRGLQPRLDVIETPSRLAGCADFDEFAQRVEGSTGPLDAAARDRLRRWYDADPERARQGGAPMRWAFVSWSCEGVGQS